MVADQWGNVIILFHNQNVSCSCRAFQWRGMPSVTPGSEWGPDVSHLAPPYFSPLFAESWCLCLSDELASSFLKKNPPDDHRSLLSALKWHIGAFLIKVEGFFMSRKLTEI